MVNNLAAFTPIQYSLELVELLWNETIYTEICNTKYEGEIKKAGDRVRVRTAQKLILSAYTKGMVLSAQDLNPIFEDLIVDKQFYFKFVVDEIDKFQNDIDTISTEAGNSKRDISELIDADILSYAWTQVHGLNALGTNYTTGNVAVAVGTGVVTGTGTAFTASMVGATFRAVGQTLYYRISAFTNATTITIVNLDGTAYSGPAITAGATFIAYAASAIALTRLNVYGYLVDIKTLLSKRLTPRIGRKLIINADLEGLILKAPEFIPAVGEAYSQVVKQGLIGKIATFDVMYSELVAGDNINGYYFLACDKSFLAFAMQVMEVVVIPSGMDPNSFVSTCKGLVTWGRKVFEGNRGRGAYLRGTI